MKNMKRLILSALLLILVAALLAGCVGFSIGTDNTVTIPQTGRITDTPGNNNPTGGDSGNNDIGSNIIIETVTPEATQNTLADTIERIHPSVVVINATLSSGTSAGSGVIISVSENYSYIITCHHVVDNATAIEVLLTNGNSYEAVFVGGLPDKDIAVLRIAVTDGISYAQIRNLTEAPIRMGDDAIAIGNPLGTLGGTVTKGIISATAREINIEGTVMTLLQTDASVNSGNSGGGLFDMNGLLIGIVNAKSAGTNVEGLGFAIPIDTAIGYASDLIETSNDSNNQYGGLGYIPGKFMLGVTISLVESEGNYYYLLSGSDPYGSFAGILKEGDYIVSVNGTTFSPTSTLAAVLKNAKIGDTLNVMAKVKKEVKQGLFVSYTYENKSFTVTIKQYVYGYAG